MFTYSHAKRPLGQSERVYYLTCSYFIKVLKKVHCIICNLLTLAPEECIVLLMYVHSGILTVVSVICSWTGRCL